VVAAPPTDQNARVEVPSVVVPVRVTSSQVLGVVGVIKLGGVEITAESDCRVAVRSIGAHVYQNWSPVPQMILQCHMRNYETMVTNLVQTDPVPASLKFVQSAVECLPTMWHNYYSKMIPIEL